MDQKIISFLIGFSFKTFCLHSNKLKTLRLDIKVFVFAVAFVFEMFTFT